MSEQSGRRTIAQELRNLILLSALPLVVLIALLTYFGYQDARGNAEAFVRRQAARVSIDVIKFLGESERGLRLIAARPDVKRMDPAHCDRGLGDLIAIQPRYVNVNVIDREGWIICGAIPAQGGPRSINVSDREWFQAAMAGKPLAIGIPRKGPILGRWISSVAVPVEGANGRVVGVVVTAIDLVGWEPAGSLGVLPERTALGVIDKAGTIVMRYPEAEKWVGRNNRDSGIVASMLRVGDGVFDAPGVQGFERIWAVVPIPGTDWLAYTGISSSAVLGPPLKETAFVVALAVLALMVAAWLALRASRRLARPIAAIAEAARMRATGSDKPVPVAGPSEVVEVARELNRMIEAWQHADASLRASETSLRESQYIAHLGNYAFDFVTGIWTSSEALDKLLGIDHSYERSMEGWLALVHPDDRDTLVDYSPNEVIGRVQTFDREYRVIRQNDRSERWLWSRSMLERDGQGEPLRLHGTTQDITERKRTEQALQESSARVSALSRRLISVQEDQSRQLVRELHDEIGQVLSAVRLNLKLIEREDNQGLHRESLAEGLMVIERAISQVRGMSLRLRPPVLDELGIVSALRWLVQRHPPQLGLRINFEAVPEDIALPRNLAEVCYRIVQEALTNVAKHAAASEVLIRLERTGVRATVIVRDNGRGFDATGARAAGGLGLLGMEERVKLVGGKLQVSPLPGGGTEVRADVGLTA